MRIVIVGGNGQVGRAATAALRARGHDVMPVSRSTEFDAYTGDGVAEAMFGADAVLDATRTPSLEEQVVADYLRTSTGNLLSAERAMGVRLHVPVSIVGMERVPGLGYYRAKLIQEATIAGGDVPYTMLRSTQFMEFLSTILVENVQDGVARLPTSYLQPIAVSDLAEILADVMTASPTNGIVEAAGPEPLPFDKIGRLLAAWCTGGNRLRRPAALRRGVAGTGAVARPRCAIGAHGPDRLVRQPKPIGLGTPDLLCSIRAITNASSSAAVREHR